MFGGGAKYSNGEDSLFIMECIKKGLKILALPISIGREEERESTWFKGYNKKFFYDRGVLYRPLYGVWAKPLAMRWLVAHRKTFFADTSQEVTSIKGAYKLMKEGMKEF